jgi:hypothetical protein
MIMEVKFRINKYTQVFNIVSKGYGGLTKFILEDQGTVLVFLDKEIALWFY